MPNFRLFLLGFLTVLSPTCFACTDSLAAWRRVLEHDPNNETAWYCVGQLSLAAGDVPSAVEATDAGIEAHPDSARLYLLKADALQSRGDWYQARATLAAGLAKVKDLELYRRSAEDENGFSGSAALAARQYAELLAGNVATPDDYVPALRRGLERAVRENDAVQVQWFAEKLGQAGLASFAAEYVPSTRETVSTTMIPGGIEGLAFVARAREHTTPDNFFPGYAQTIVNYVDALDQKSRRQYLDDIELYFRKLAELERLGHREKDQAVVELSLQDKNAGKILELLGMRLRGDSGEVSIEESAKGARQQDLAGALGVDAASISKSFAHGKEYRIEIPYQPVAVWPEEKLWRETFYDRQQMYGGLAEAIVRRPRLARLYKALNVLDRPTLEALLQACPLNDLYDRHVDLLSRYSTTLSVREGRAVIPGGEVAEPVWAQLTGANPRQPGAFFRSLLDRDGGRLMAFFFTLSQLDPPHQRFFTLNASRAGVFYGLFGESVEGQRTSSLMRDTSFTDFLREIPLKGDGHVNFPGSAEVWLVAKGSSPPESKTARLLKQAAGTVAPDREDEVLVRLANTRYRQNARALTEIDNFIAVSRIDAHRSRPLDEETALLLAQRYSAWSAVYPYFTTLTGVDGAQLRSFFAALDKIGEQKNAAANPVAGEFHALIELLCLLQRRGELTESQAATLFGGISEQFATDAGPTAISMAAARGIAEILSHCAHASAERDPDLQLRAVLLGTPHPIRAGYGERSVTLDPTGLRRHGFDRVLEMQKAPALAPLIEIGSVAGAMRAGGVPTPAQIETLRTAVARIASIAPGKEMKLSGRDKENLLLYETSPLTKSVAEIAQKAAQKKPNATNFRKLGADLLAEEQPQFTLALSGLIYAWYLRAADLPVSEDWLLLRKHRYQDFQFGAATRLNVPSFFWTESDGAGSYFSGGFAAFANAAGQAATVGFEAGKGVPNTVIAAQIAAVRDTDWDRLEDSDQRLFNLRVQLGREWIALSAAQTDAFTGLARQTAGLLSPARRSELLGAIAARLWPRVWNTVTLSDLYTLGMRCAVACDAQVLQSPVAMLLREASARNDGHNLDRLGPVPSALYGCNHPHLLHAAAPYEEYERHLFPNDIAERSAEFKMQLVLAADQAGISPAALGVIAEPLLRDVLSKAEMSASFDWRSLLNACAAVDARRVWEKLEAQ